jgi:transposase
LKRRYSKPARSVLVINAASTIMLSMAIEAMYPGKRLIHVLLDNARYHHAKPVQQWLARSGCRIRLDFIPSYCPHLDPIERLWGLMHRHWTHSICTLGSRISLESGTDFFAREGAEKLVCLLRPSHRQLPRHRYRSFSGCRVRWVYHLAYDYAVIRACRRFNV